MQTLQTFPTTRQQPCCRSPPVRRRSPAMGTGHPRPSCQPAQSMARPRVPSPVRKGPPQPRSPWRKSLPSASLPASEPRGGGLHGRVTRAAATQGAGLQAPRQPRQLGLLPPSPCLGEVLSRVHVLLSAGEGAVQREQLRQLHHPRQAPSPRQRSEAECCPHSVAQAGAPQGQRRPRPCPPSLQCSRHQELPEACDLGPAPPARPSCRPPCQGRRRPQRPWLHLPGPNLPHPSSCKMNRAGWQSGAAVALARAAGGVPRRALALGARPSPCTHGLSCKWRQTELCIVVGRTLPPQSMKPEPCKLCFRMISLQALKTVEMLPVSVAQVTCQ